MKAAGARAAPDLAGLKCFLACLGLLIAWPSFANPLAIGSLHLEACGHDHAYCGSMDRALDPTGTTHGRIAIHFEYYRHTKPGSALGTLVATEGGPGYPATLSRADYLSLLGPLLKDHDFVLMDNRGTGGSGAVDCHELQVSPAWTVGAVGRCGDSLGDRAPLYSTAYAADDLEAILSALAVGRVDLYGDSYGTYFEQVFVLRHPARLRSIVLDGAYPIDGPDYAWYPTYAGAVRDKFNIVCARSSACAQRPGNGIEHLRPLLESLRAHPFAARGRDSDGKQIEFKADASKLAIVMFGSAPPLSTVRELDAAARAFEAADQLPLLRLMAETSSAVDSRDPTADPTKWSAGLAAAVMCQDPPQIFDMGLAPAARRHQFDRVITERARRFPDTYAPFTIDEYRGMPLDYSFIEQCLEWPTPPPVHAAAHVVPENAAYPDIPALILSGELDTVTTMADGAAVAKEFKRARQVKFANSFHVNALPRSRSECGGILVRRFIETLNAGDASCAASIPPIRVLPLFPRHVSELTAPHPLKGNQADASELQWAEGALLTAGDVLTRIPANSSGSGTGLRGGTFELHEGASQIRAILHEVRFMEELEVSGLLVRPSARSGVVSLQLSLQAEGVKGQLAIHWQEPGAAPMAVISGRINGKSVRAITAAP
jgi:pimeloyl-ACP methyl ester carboxylesterase